jgi:hypothetical protein
LLRRRIAYHSGVSPSGILAAVLATALGVVPLAPPEHVHEAGEHGHHQRVVHRHFEEHRLGPDPGFRAHVEDDDAPLLTLNTVFTVPSTHAVPVAAPVEAVRIDAPAAVASFYRTPYVERVIHGPPRAPASPRAPPFPPAA